MRVHAVALGLLLASTSARADDRPPPKTSYALQTVLVETAGAAFVVRAFFTQSPLMLGTGTAMWALGGAAVHVAHGNGVAAVISPVIMVGVPAAFFFSPMFLLGASRR